MITIGKPNDLERAAGKFGLTNADCLKNPRWARLVSYKARLDEEIDALVDVEARGLGKLVDLTEADYSDQRVFDLLKGILASRRHLATLRPRKAKVSPK
jgi:hypothetical protein